MEIVNELFSLLKAEPIPKQLELTILPLEDDNTPFLKEDIYLGIHFPCLAQLSRDFRSVYKQMKNGVLSMEDEKFGDDMMKVLTCLLLVCPDHATAWSDRRRLVLKKLSQHKQKHDEEKRKILQNELCYLDLLFTQHSKAPNSWAYRKWVWKMIIPFYLMNDQSKTTRELLTKELSICTSIADKYPKNYYCWTYRLNIVIDYAHMQQNKSEAVKQLMESEIQWLTHVWLQQHVSDHSAAHYGGEILRLYLKLLKHDSGCDNASWKLQYLSKLMWDDKNSCKFYVEKFPSNEVVWIWRRICSRLFLEFVSKQSKVVAVKEHLQIVNRFIDNEALSVLKRFGSDSHGQENASLYAKKYVSWNLKHLQMFQIEIGDNYQRIVDLFDVSIESRDLLHKYWTGNVEKFFNARNNGGNSQLITH